MPEGGRTSFEHEIDEKLRKLDAQIKVPEIPDAQAIFERAEKKKNNVFSFRSVRYAAAAAVILICVSIPTVSMLMTKNGASTDNAAFMAAPKAQDNEETEKGAPPMFGISSSAVQEGAEESEASDELVQENGITVGEALENYFSSEKKSENSTTGGGGSERDAGSFTDKLNKKRTADVEINEDSVSVMLYDVSGQSEILTALWVEGALMTCLLFLTFCAIEVICGGWSATYMVEAKHMSADLAARATMY